MTCQGWSGSVTAMTSSIPAAGSAIGGRRPSTVMATYTAQIIGLVTPARKRRLRELATRYGLSQSEIVRRCVDAGLSTVESDLAAERRTGAI